MLTGITVWVLFLLFGIAALLILYRKLLNELEQRNPDEFEAIGRPSLFMFSPSRGIRLQKFIYFDSRDSGISPSVGKLCRLLAVLTPTFVILVLIGLLWGAFDFLSAI